MKEQDLFTEQDLIEAVEALAMLPFFPSDSGGAVMTLLGRMCPHRTALRWLIAETVNQCEKWPGPAGLRGILCTRYTTADDVDHWSNIPGYRAEDAEAKYYERQEQITQGDMSQESKKFLAVAMVEMDAKLDGVSVLDRSHTEKAENRVGLAVKRTRRGSLRCTPIPKDERSKGNKMSPKNTEDASKSDSAARGCRSENNESKDRASAAPSMRIVRCSKDDAELELQGECGTEFRSVPLKEADQLLAMAEGRRHAQQQ